MLSRSFSTGGRNLQSMWNSKLLSDLSGGHMLMVFSSQSKLSQEELNQLQKDTHFDKKELQQWYKGMLSRWLSHAVLPLIELDMLHRVSQGLPERHAHQGRVSEDL